MHHNILYPRISKNAEMWKKSALRRVALKLVCWLCAGQIQKMYNSANIGEIIDLDKQTK